MKSKKRIVLAYSGGLDTSIILKWLQENYKAEIICYTADIGQKINRKKIISNAKKFGVKKIIIKDLRDVFIKDYVFPMIRGHAIYEGIYLLGTSIARPLIAKDQIRIAKKFKAYAVSHGATGKGNDQIRFELGYHYFGPKVKIIAPWRIWKLKSRTDLINYAKKNRIVIPKDKKWLDRLSRNYVKDQNFLNQLNIQFAEDEIFYETKAGKKFKETNFKKRCEIDFAMMLSKDYSNINFFVIDNLLKSEKPKTFLQFANHAISETKALYKIRATKKSSNVMFWQIRENGHHSHTTYGIFRYITKFIENGAHNIFYVGKDLFGNMEPAPLFNPSINIFRKCISEIKKVVNNLIICHPNKTDVFWSVPNEGDYPDDFLEKIEKLAKEKKLSRSEIAQQDEKIRKEFVERQKRVVDAHRISANGANFDNIISNNPKLLKELNKILKDVLNLKLVVITPKFLKKILKDPSLYNVFRNAQRSGLMYPTGMGMYRRNKFIMLQDLKFKRKFYIHGEEVGKGPTNIIPFLAQILSDRPNLTYLVQELENNWHPKYQSKIIELIARIIKSRISRTFILETHSELFVLQVQKLVQKGILKSNEVSINYISRNKLGDSEVHHLPLNSQGGFEKKWPGGFFTERMEILTS